MVTDPDGSLGAYTRHGADVAAAFRSTSPNSPPSLLGSLHTSGSQPPQSSWWFTARCKQCAAGCSSATPIRVLNDCVGSLKDCGGEAATSDSGHRLLDFTFVPSCGKCLDDIPHVQGVCQGKRCGESARRKGRLALTGRDAREVTICSISQSFLGSASIASCVANGTANPPRTARMRLCASTARVPFLLLRKAR